MVVTIRKMSQEEKTEAIPPKVEKIPEQPKRPVGRPRKEDSTGAAAASHAKSNSLSPKPPAAANLKPPNFAEWSDFFGTVVFRWATRAIATVILRGIDREQLTPEEKEDIDLDDEQLQAIAKPFAHMATRSAFLTKHGRMILDSKDAIEASVIMFMWMGRVNRIAKRYRPKHQKPERNVQNVGQSAESVNSGQDVPQEQGNGYYIQPAVGAGFN